VFDLRYHVASLAAVFVALVLGIFVGVGLSGRGFVSDAERENLEARIDELRVERDEAVARAQDADRRGDAFDSFARTTYDDLVQARLDGRSVGVVFVGSVDQGLARTVRRTVSDAGGRVTLLRALRVPLDDEAVDTALRAEPETRDVAGPDNRERLGRELARELVAAGPNPVLDRVAGVLIEEQSGGAVAPVDAIVVARPARPQRGETESFLDGLYSGLAAAPVPSVGVEKSDAETSAVGVFRRRGLATVDRVDAAPGQVALVYLLAGARPGSYGLGADAVDGVLPIPPPATTAPEG
jgi:Copper transport outer membrane protein, MctB